MVIALVGTIVIIWRLLARNQFLQSNDKSMLPKLIFTIISFISSISLLWLVSIMVNDREGRNYEAWITLAITYVKFYMFNLIVSQASIILAAVYLWWLSTQRLKATVKLDEDQKSDTKQPIIEALNSTEIAPTVHKESLGLVADTIDTDSEDGDADDKKQDDDNDSVDSWEAPMSDMVKAMLTADVKRRANLRDSILSSQLSKAQIDRDTLKNELLSSGSDSN